MLHTAQSRAGSARTEQAGALVLTTLLGATLIGTLINNILNVPLREITRDFHAPLSGGVLVVSSFVLVLAAAMPLTGWVGDRFGRRRTLVAALTLMTLAMVGAALAPSLPVLVAFRAVQGLACAAIPPAVMAMLSAIFGPQRRARTMSGWAAANGVGQAVGPPLGGLLADASGWRAIFWVLAPLTVVVLAATAWFVPDDPRRPARLHWPGAATLTIGSALLMTAATLVPQRSVPGWLDGALAGLGFAFVGAFAVVSSRAVHPLIRTGSLMESRFLRSGVAAFAQMFCLAAVLVAVPLYVTGTLGCSTAVTGLLVFALPATMAVAAPGIGVLSERAGPRLVLRTGLVVLIGAELAIGWYLDGGHRGLGVLVATLVAVGGGVALVQTPAATGATRSPAGRSGAALGLFNMLRFGGSALGAAWVAVVYPHGAFLLLFAGCAVMAAVGLLVSFAGPDPVATTA
ncbi:MAG TPA: MFS transporter [Jatrophihabitantaceae bacterium]